jgi:hypothetical protein
MNAWSCLEKRAILAKWQKNRQLAYAFVVIFQPFKGKIEFDE